MNRCSHIRCRQSRLTMVESFIEVPSLTRHALPFLLPVDYLASCLDCSCLCFASVRPPRTLDMQCHRYCYSQTNCQRWSLFLQVVAFRVSVFPVASIFDPSLISIQHSHTNAIPRIFFRKSHWALQMHYAFANRETNDQAEDYHYDEDCYYAQDCYWAAYRNQLEDCNESEGCHQAQKSRVNCVGETPKSTDARFMQSRDECSVYWTLPLLRILQFIVSWW